MTDIKYLAQETDVLWRKMRRSFIDLNYAHESDYPEIKKTIEYCAQQIYQNGKLFFEIQGLPECRKEFIEEIGPIMKDKNAILDTEYFDEVGESFSTLSDKFYKFFSPFKEFNEASNEDSEDQYGRGILENILGATCNILLHRGVTPKNEPDIYPAIRNIVEVVFPVHKTPTTSFIKHAGEYKPDVLLPKLKCAVEYKLAKTAKELKKTIDDILIDVSGYDDHTNYDFFYAVFYVKSGLVTSKKFDTLWKEKKFPKNWKSIFVEGPVS